MGVRPIGILYAAHGRSVFSISFATPGRGPRVVFRAGAWRNLVFIRRIRRRVPLLQRLETQEFRSIAGSRH